MVASTLLQYHWFGDKSAYSMQALIITELIEELGCKPGTEHSVSKLCLTAATKKCNFCFEGEPSVSSSCCTFRNLTTAWQAVGERLQKSWQTVGQQSASIAIKVVYGATPYTFLQLVSCSNCQLVSRPV